MGLGLDGATIVLVIARFVLLGVGLYGAWRVQKLLAPVRLHRLRTDARTLFEVAGPAVLTNLATPVGAGFVTHSVAQFGASAVAGQATIDRLTPVAFGLIYSLSGAVGPVLAQNLGTIPFAWWGSHYGPVEVLAGQAAGAALFGSLALYVAFRLTRWLGK